MAVIEKITDLAKQLAGARDAIGELHRADRELRAEHHQRTEERARLCGMLPPRADVIESIRNVVDRSGAAWREQHSAALVQAAADRLDVGADGMVRGVLVGNVASAIPVIDFAALCGLMPDAVTTALVATVEGTSYPEGPAMAERQHTIAEIDRQLAALEAQTLQCRRCRGRIRNHPRPDAGGARPAVASHQRKEQAERFNRDNRDGTRRGAIAAMPVE